MTNKELIDSTLQVGLFLATGGLILTGIKQVKVAGEQAKAAYAQVEGFRRPFFQIKRGERHSADRWQASLHNEGPGVAFDTTWRLLGNFSDLITYIELGAVGVRASVQMPFCSLGTRKTLDVEDITSEGVLIEYQDTAGKRYWSTMTMAPEGFLITKTGEGNFQS